jgi:hypothetical protein
MECVFFSRKKHDSRDEGLLDNKFIALLSLMLQRFYSIESLISSHTLRFLLASCGREWAIISSVL